MRGIKQYYNYSIISFDELISRTNLKVVNYYFENEIKIEKINRDFKKLYVHYLIKELCSICMETKSGMERVLFCNPNFVSVKSELFDTLDYQEFCTFLRSMLKELGSVLPITIFESVDINYADVSDLKTNGLRMVLDVLCTHQKKKSIQKLTQYAEQLGLNLVFNDFNSGYKLHKIFI